MLGRLCIHLLVVGPEPIFCFLFLCGIRRTASHTHHQRPTVAASSGCWRCIEPFFGDQRNGDKLHLACRGEYLRTFFLLPLGTILFDTFNAQDCLQHSDTHDHLQHCKHTQSSSPLSTLTAIFNPSNNMPFSKSSTYMKLPDKDKKPRSAYVLSMPCM